MKYMTFEEVESLKSGDIVEMLSYPELLQIFFEAKVISEQGYTKALTDYYAYGLFTRIRTPMGVSILSDMAEKECGRSFFVNTVIKTAYLKNGVWEPLILLEGSPYCHDRTMFRSKEKEAFISDDEYSKLF